MVVTWNPTDKGASTNLSNGNLTATPIYQTSSVKSTISQNKGKWYCEIRIDAVNINCIGIGKPTLPMTSAISASTDFYYYYADGRKGNSGVVSAYGSAMAVNSIIGILVDFDIGTLTFYKDGVSQGVAFNDIKKLGEFVIIASSGTLSGTGGVTANFGATPFVYPPDKTKLPFGVKSYDGSQVLSYEQKTMIKDNEGYKRYVTKQVGQSELNTAIPIMTSNTTPSGVADASSVYDNDSRYVAWRAFNEIADDINNAWISKTTANEWITYEFPEEIITNKYSIAPNVVMNNSQPKSFRFEGLADGKWVVLDSRENVTTGWVANQYSTFEFYNNTPYKKYRLFILSNNGYVSYISIAGLRIYKQSSPSILNSGWDMVSTTLPTAQQFLEKGMVDPLDILSRNVQDGSHINMTDKSEILNDETGLVFGATIDLKKYFDLRSIRTEVK